jgi:hypothetical protein
MNGKELGHAKQFLILVLEHSQKSKFQATRLLTGGNERKVWMQVSLFIASSEI